MGIGGHMAWTRVFGNIICVVHVALLVVYFLLVLSQPASWGSSHATFVPVADSLEAGAWVPGDENLYRTRAYQRYVPPADRQATCKAQVFTPSVQSGVFEGVSTGGQHALETCYFGKVANVMDMPVSPHAFFELGACTPDYLLLILQFAVVSHLFWASAPIHAFLSRGTKPSAPHAAPYDLLVALSVLAGGCVFTALQYEKMKVVHSNILLGVVVLGFTAGVELLWSWCTSGAAASLWLHSTLPPPKEAKQLMSVQQPPFELLNMDVVMGMPLVTPEKQYKHHTTWGMVNGAGDLLFQENLLVVPRYITMSLVVPLTAACSFFVSDGNWRKEEVLALCSLLFLVSSLTVPMYVLARICGDSVVAQHKADTPSSLETHTISSWMFLCFFCMCVMCFICVGLAHYLVYLDGWADYTSTVLALGLGFYGAFVSACVPVVVLVSPKLGYATALVEIELRTAAVSFVGLYFILS